MARAELEAVQVDDGGSSRLEELREAVGRLRTRAGGSDMERNLFIAGAVLLPLGIAIIGLGWYGAANHQFVFDQIPYLISGGLLGLALVVLGGFLYFGYWLTRLVSEQREQADRIVEAIDKLATAQSASELIKASPPAVSPGRVERSAARSRGRVATTRGASFVATAQGTMFHRPDCVVVAGKRGLRRVSGRERGFEPCRICDPTGEA